MFRYECEEGICTLVLASQMLQEDLGTPTGTQGQPHTLAVALGPDTSSALRGWSEDTFIQKG